MKSIQLTNPDYFNPQFDPMSRRTSFAGLACFLAMAGCLAFAIGCGSKPEVASAPAQQDIDTGADQVVAQPEPTEIVSQFLDRMRRGGDDSSASQLLTKLAQQELTRIGHTLQLPGSPDTQFKVGQAMQDPDHSDTVWVETVLTEPTDGGQPVPYEVVWTLRSENDGWRISGFATDPGEDLPPMRFDFENGDEFGRRIAEVIGEPEPVQR